MDQNHQNHHEWMGDSFGVEVSIMVIKLRITVFS
jgi:hypothetical protein